MFFGIATFVEYTITMFKVQVQVSYHYDQQCICKLSLAGYENYLNISEIYKVNLLK